MRGVKNGTSRDNVSRFLSLSKQQLYYCFPGGVRRAPLSELIRRNGDEKRKRQFRRVEM